MADESSTVVRINNDEKNGFISSFGSLILAFLLATFFFYPPVLRYMDASPQVVNYVTAEGASVPYLLHLPSFAGIRLATSHVGLGIYLHPSLPGFKSKRVHTLVETSLPYYASESRLPIILVSPLRPRQLLWTDRRGLSTINQLHEQVMSRHALIVDKQRVFMIGEGDAGSAALATVVANPRLYAGLVLIDAPVAVSNLSRAASMLAHNEVATLVIETAPNVAPSVSAYAPKGYAAPVKRSVARPHTPDTNGELPYTLLHAYTGLVRAHLALMSAFSEFLYNPTLQGNAMPQINSFFLTNARTHEKSTQPTESLMVSLAVPISASML